MLTAPVWAKFSDDWRTNRRAAPADATEGSLVGEEELRFGAPHRAVPSREPLAYP